MMKPKQTPRASTYALPNGGVIHIDRLIVPIAEPTTTRCELHNLEHYKGTMCPKCYEAGPWSKIPFAAEVS